MDEFELIERYFTRGVPRDDVRVGVGDDGAVTKPPAGHEQVAVLDTIVAGVHFPRELDAADVAYRAVAVNLSDLAAMGAKPCWMMLGLTLPEARASWLDAFARGLFEIADAHDLALIGGDTTRGTETVVTVQMTGHVAPGRFLCRRGARAGDAICVSGTVGDAAAGLESITSGAGHAFLEERFRRPTPRIALGAALAGIASAAIDVSDGLYADLGRLLHASGAGGTVDCERLPLSPALERTTDRSRAVSLALGGGDDYELCFTVAPEREHEAFAAAARLAVPVTRIGAVEAAGGLQLRQDGRRFEYRDAGYRHFREQGRCRKRD